MKNPLALLALCLMLAAPAASRADDYALDASHTSIIFGVKHAGFSYCYGRFNKVSGNYSLDKADPSKSKFNFIIATESVDTNNAARDGHLRNADFFDAGQYPTITFESKSAEVVEDEGKTIYKVTGDLTMHGKTKEVTLDMELLGEGQGMGGYRSGFLCQTKLMRSDFGMSGSIPMIGDEVAVTVSFEGTRQ